MVILCRVELLDLNNFCDDWVDEMVLMSFDLSFCCSLLLEIGIHYSWSILCALVMPLPVQSRWIMNLEEYFKQPILANLLRVIPDLDYFSVSWLSRADVFIRGILSCATSIPRQDFPNTSHMPVDWVNAPEAATTNNESFSWLFHFKSRLLRRFLIFSWQFFSHCTFKFGFFN